MSHAHVHVEPVHLILILVLLLAPWRATAQERAPTEKAEGGFDPAQVEVLVIGSPHLRGMSEEDKPATDLIRRRLLEFEPDHVVVEWLHPSIDPATTENYRPFEDLSSLARLWDYELSTVETALERTLDVLDTQQTYGLPTAPTRVELGKLYYLNRDRLNAGYHWWMAERSGADVRDLKRLTHDNFEGHELEVWGFPVAQRQELEYITPFDYQGEDAAWIWMDIVGAVMTHALKTKHGLKEGDADWEMAVERYAQGVEAWANEGNASWLEQYGDIREVAEFADVVEIWTGRRSRERLHEGPPGLAEMRYNQSDEHAADTRYMYDDVFPRISLDGLGQRMVDNWLLRNRRMVDFVEQDAARLGSERVMILVGEGHRPFLVEELKERGYRIAPASEFIP